MVLLNNKNLLSLFRFLLDHHIENNYANSEFIFNIFKFNIGYSSLGIISNSFTSSKKLSLKEINEVFSYK